MNIDDAMLRNWLSQERTELTSAIFNAVSNHVSALSSQGIDFYGYALLPGEPYDINRIVAAFNCELDIKVSTEHEDYGYYKYIVDEWLHRLYDGFDSVNKLLEKANTEFLSMYTKDENNYLMDEYEMLHSDSLLEAVVRGLEIAKENGVFGTKNLFLVVWISDSDHKIINESVCRLNSKTVMHDFMAV